MRFYSVLVCVLCAVFAACNVANNNANTSRSGNDASPVAKVSGAVLKPEQSAKVGNVNVTFNSARVVPPGQFDQPKPGMQVIATDFSVQNTANQPYTLSTLLSLSMLDKDKRKYSIALTANLNGSIDGTIPPNGSVRGEVAFEVPTDGAPYVVQFTQPVGNQSASWTVMLP